MKATGKLRINRKGQATVIGMVLFLVLFLTSVGLIYNSIYRFNEYNMAVQESFDADIARVHEDLDIAAAYLNENGNLVLNMTNRGTSMTHPTRLWIINQTDNSHYNYDFNNLYLEPGETVSNVTQVTLTTGKDYAIRIVTDKGNIVSYNLVPRVRVHIGIVTPGFVPATDELNVVLFYTNNDTSENNIYNLQPTLTYSQVTLLEGPEPTSISLLPKDGTAIFHYKFQAPQTEETTVTFNASFVGAPEGNFVTATTKCGYVAFAEQSQAATTVETASSGAIDVQGRLYLHDDSVLDGKIMDPVMPTGSGVSLSNPNVKFYTVNDTSTRTIAAGDWNLSIWYDRSGAGAATQVRIIYEVVSQDGSIVISTIDDYTNSFARSETVVLETITRAESAVNLTAQQRLRLSLIYQSGKTVNIYFDSSSRDSYLQTPTPDPLFSTSIGIISGETIVITLSNPSNNSVVITQLSRIILRSTVDNTTYAGLVTDWANTSDPGITTSITHQQDSRVIPPGDSIILQYSAPSTIPSRTGLQGSHPPAGTYRMLIAHLTGYDSTGAVYVGIIDFGEVDVSE